MRQVRFDVKFDEPRALRSWGTLAAFLLAVAAAALTPLLDRSGDAAVAANENFPGWPSHYEGRALTEMALTPREAAFVRGFPGRSAASPTVGAKSSSAGLARRRDACIPWPTAFAAVATA